MTSKPTKKSASPLQLSCSLPVVLVGMMGVGKTTIGRRLAPRLGIPFHDADLEIEQAAGMKVVDFFAQHGEAAFRDGEARVIKRLIAGPPIVLATGGGAILREETRTLIRESSLSIWLKAPIDVIVDRATRRPTRPLLRNGKPREILTRLLNEREPLYREAALYEIESQSGSHTRTVGLILDVIRTHLENNQEPAATECATTGSAKR